MHLAVSGGKSKTGFSEELYAFFNLICPAVCVCLMSSIYQFRYWLLVKMEQVLIVFGVL